MIDDHSPQIDTCERCGRDGVRVYVVYNRWICVVCHDWVNEFGDDQSTTGTEAADEADQATLAGDY